MFTSLSHTVVRGPIGAFFWVAMLSAWHTSRSNAGTTNRSTTDVVIAISRSGDPVVLTPSSLSRVNSTTGVASELKIPRGPSRLLDLAIAQNTGDIFVLSSDVNSSSHYGYGASDLLRYDDNGVLSGSWALIPELGEGAVAGLAVDSNGTKIYFTSAREGRVYSLDIRDDSKGRSPDDRHIGKLQYVATIRKAFTLGPIALDTPRNRLFVADPIEGRIFTVSISPERQKGELAEAQAFYSVPEPSRLAVGPASDSLFILDRGIRLVRFDLTKPSSAADIKRFDEPQSGLAIGSNGIVWTCGRTSEFLLELRANGRKMFSFSPLSTK